MGRAGGSGMASRSNGKAQKGKRMTEKRHIQADDKTPTETLRQPPSLKMMRNSDGTLKIQASGDYSRLETVVSNMDVSNGLVMQLAALGFHGKQIDEPAANLALGFVDSMEPRDAAEALLVTQMAAIHQATMMMARRLNQVDSIPLQDSAERALNKLGRTFTAQMDTLKRYRSKGQQTVRVERVMVQDGGQAIVGNVAGGGAADGK